jgi:hypothetical protein
MRGSAPRLARRFPWSTAFVAPDRGPPAHWSMGERPANRVASRAMRLAGYGFDAHYPAWPHGHKAGTARQETRMDSGDRELSPDRESTVPGGMDQARPLPKVEQCVDRPLV